VARVLTNSNNYGSAFTTPREPRENTLVRRPFPTQLRRLWRPLDGAAVWDPRERWDLMHSFNRVPVTAKPFLVTFESALPRTYGRAYAVARNVLRERLVRDNCRGVIALSDYAVRRTRGLNADWAGLPRLEAKMQVIHPNLPLLRREPKPLPGGPIRLVFVGRQWARKGGVVAVRLAAKARQRGLPVEVTIVSPLTYGANVYTDHPDAGRYAADVRLLDGPNVTVHRSLGNEDVLRLMAESTFTLLPTVNDTYGFTVLEGFSVGTPTIVSRTGALPEVVRDEVNGYLLDVPTDDVGDWVHLHERSWDRLDALYESMADQVIERIEAFLDAPDTYEALSEGAIDQIRRSHEAATVGAQLEAVYASAVDLPTTRRPATRT
jgi:glycosyltransferase involved in cell wall biosynthesis